MIKCKFSIRTLTFVLLVSLLSPLSVFAQNVNNIKIYTEQYPPYNFEKGGKPAGIFVTIMEDLLKEVGSKLSLKDIKVKPWARGYKMLLEKKHTCLFGITKTEERTPLFKWVGPVADTVIGVTAKKSRNLKVKTVDELKKLKIAVVRDDIGEQLLITDGLKRKSLKVVSKPSLMINLLGKNKVDAIAYELNVTKWELKELGFDPSEYETIYVLKKAQIYYGFNKKTSQGIVDKFQKALNNLKKSGKVKEALNKYLK